MKRVQKGVVAEIVKLVRSCYCEVRQYDDFTRTVVFFLKDCLRFAFVFIFSFPLFFVFPLKALADNLEAAPPPIVLTLAANRIKRVIFSAASSFMSSTAYERLWSDYWLSLSNEID